MMATVTVYLTERERRRTRARAAGAAMLAFAAGVVAMSVRPAEQAVRIEREPPRVETGVRTETVVEYVTQETVGPPAPVEEKRIRRRVPKREPLPRRCCM